ncbi:hypothetical protein [Streptomyces azureus]|uniref:hypothetical protein n=1 Tax=Streptomyces azureus TaxID=146537 RepID=UPI0011DFF09D|nr:hypothetical protein [Streptomyces azureus]
MQRRRAVPARAAHGFPAASLGTGRRRRRRARPPHGLGGVQHRPALRRGRHLPTGRPGRRQLRRLHGHEPTFSTGLSTPGARDKALLAYLTAHRSGEKYLLATQAAYTAEPLLRAASDPLLVMGGFTGLTPFPSAARLSTLVGEHQVRYVMLTTQRPSTPATAWVKGHCSRVSPRAYEERRTDGSFTLYDCRPTAG